MQPFLLLRSFLIICETTVKLLRVFMCEAQGKSLLAALLVVEYQMCQSFFCLFYTVFKLLCK